MKTIPKLFDSIIQKIPPITLPLRLVETLLVLEKHKAKSDFELRLRRISYFATNHGSRSTCMTAFGSPKRFFDNSERRKPFLKKCHEGFEIAQKEIIDELLLKEERIPVLKKAYSVEVAYFKKRGRKPPLPRYTKAGMEYAECMNEMDMLKEVANSIAWQLVHGDGTVLRAMWQGKTGGFLKDRNIKSAIEMVDGINKDQNGFALIADITSCMQVGDILMRDPKSHRLCLSELKEGKISEKIEDILKSPPQCPVVQNKMADLVESHGVGFIKQFERTIRQKIRMKNVEKFVNTCEGIHTASGLPCSMNKEPVDVETYHEAVIHGFKEIKKGNHVSFVIDDCLMLGFFNNKKLSKSHDVCEMDFKHEAWHAFHQPWEDCAYGNQDDTTGTHLIDYLKLPAIDIFQKIRSPSHTPIFINGLPRDIVFDLLFRRKSLFFYFSQKKFFELCLSKGIKAQLLTGKEFRRTRASLEKKGTSLVTFEEQLIKLQNEEETYAVFLGGGALFRMVFEWHRPAAVAEQFKKHLEEAPSKMNKKGVVN